VIRPTTEQVLLEQLDELRARVVQLELRAGRPDEQQAPPWTPCTLKEQILDLLDRRRPGTWQDVADELQRDPPEVRRVGAQLVAGKLIEFEGEHPRLFPVLTQQGREVLASLRRRGAG
jgi:hypothetical protein